jgi:hypothetical protein
MLATFLFNPKNPGLFWSVKYSVGGGGRVEWGVPPTLQYLEKLASNRVKSTTQNKEKNKENGLTPRLETAKAQNLFVYFLETQMVRVITN